MEGLFQRWATITAWMALPHLVISTSRPDQWPRKCRCLPFRHVADGFVASSPGG